MEIADIAAEHLQGVHRVALAVHEQVGRVKVDAQVAGVDFLDDAEQDDGRLLAGLEPESQAALLAVDSDFADGVNDWWVFRVSHVFGDEAAVRDDGRCANHAGKVSAALCRLDEARVPYISVLTDPTTGGVTASYAMLGDLNIAEPGALIGFAGPRVIEQTIRQKLPKGFQRSEFLLQHGMLDAIVDRRELRNYLIRALRFFMG